MLWIESLTQHGYVLASAIEGLAVRNGPRAPQLVALTRSGEQVPLYEGALFADSHPHPDTTAAHNARMDDAARAGRHLVRAMSTCGLMRPEGPNDVPRGHLLSLRRIPGAVAYGPWHLGEITDDV